eukprot:6123670-Amphidinium_carterae.1
MENNVEQIVNVPLPQSVQELAGQRMEVPLPQPMEDLVEEKVVFPMPQTVENIVEQIVDMPVSLTFPFGEQMVDVPLPQTMENIDEQIMGVPVSLPISLNGSVGLPVPLKDDKSGVRDLVTEVRKSIVPRNTGRRVINHEPVPFDWEGLALIIAFLFVIPVSTLALLYVTAYVAREFREHFYPPVGMP